MSYSELAERTGLSLPGVHKVVSRMMTLGIIEFTGSGKRQQINIRNEYPLTDNLEELFKAEKRYYHSLITSLKEIIDRLEPQPRSAWIFGTLARGSDEYGDPIRIGILGNIKKIDEITDQFREQLIESGIEQRFDVTIEVSGIVLADLKSNETSYADEIIPLWGADPKHYLKNTGEESNVIDSHQELDKRSKIDAKAWVELLQRHPEIIERTIKDLEERISQISSGEKKELQEWKHILKSMSHQRLKKFLESDSERSTRLRQSLPFWPVLKNKERNKLNEIKSNRAKKDE
jgi:DNA-binding Lrp family transcriptional regulator